MRSALLILVFLLVWLDGNSQFRKGDLLLSGNGSFERRLYQFIIQGNVSSEQVEILYGMSPKIGYFITDNLVTGPAIDIESRRWYPPGLPEAGGNNRSYILGIFTRYYHDSKFFGEASAGRYFESTGEEVRTFNWSLGVGRAFLLGDILAFEPMLVYTHRSGEAYQDAVAIYSGLGLRVGFSLFIPAN